MKAKGFVCTDGTRWDKIVTGQMISKFDGVVIRSRFLLDAEMIDKGYNLKFIARAGAGMENIDVAHAKLKGIACLNAPEANRDAVGEHAIGMMLSLLNKLNKADREVRDGIWLREENRGTELQGKTVGIIGFGNMGSAFAKKLSGFDAHILVYDKYVRIDKKKYPYVKQISIEKIFTETDVLSLHIPLTDETKFLVNDSFIKSFKKNIYLINTSRGKNVNTADLVKHLKTGKIKGACLDVSEYESISFENLADKKIPAPLQYLLQCENVALSPHIAGWTHESNEKIAQVLAKKIISLKF